MNKELLEIFKENENLPIKVFYTTEIESCCWQVGDIYTVSIKELYSYTNKHDTFIYDDADDLIERHLYELYENVDIKNDKEFYNHCLEKSRNYSIGKHICIYVI